VYLARAAMILAPKTLPVGDAITQPADTCKQPHLFTEFPGLAGSNRLGVSRNRGRARSLVLLDSPRLERFGTIRVRVCLMAVTVVREVDK
jgi:hypothetical protein